MLKPIFVGKKMLPTSNKVYFRILQILVVSLSLLLIYQIFFVEKKSSEVKLTLDQSITYAEQSQKIEPIQRAIETIETFSQEQEETQMPEALPIGRNLFQNIHSFDKGSSQEIIPTAKVTPALAVMQINELIPNKIYLQNRSIKLLVKGTNLNESLKVYANNRLLETNFKDSSELESILPKELLFVEGTLSIEVKAQKLGKEIISNTLPLTIARPPMPSFTFVGMFSDADGQNTKLLLRVGAEDLTVSVGDLIKNRWKISNLSGEFLAFEDRETGLSYRMKKGERIVSQQVKKVKEVKEVKEMVQDKPIVASETTKKSGNIGNNLFERSNKPMTSKELWEKRAAMAREKKN